MEFVAGFLLAFPLFMVAVVVHEVSHGWAALCLGDQTALRAGRLTFNPFKHIDPVGTVLLPILLLVFRAPFVFGWAKPVPINALNLRVPKRDMLWVGIAGPAANFLLAVLLTVGLRAMAPLLPALVLDLGYTLVLINLVLGAFNLLPIPPLDGSRVLAGLLPLRWAWPLFALERWGILVILLLMYGGLMDWMLRPLILFLSKGLGL